MQTVYILREDYEDLVAMTRAKYRYIKEKKDIVRLTPALSFYPDVEQMKEKDVMNNFEKYFEYLMIFYICGDDFPVPHNERLQEKREESKEYIKDLFAQQLVIIEKEDYQDVIQIPYETFKAMTLEQKEEALEPLLLNFHPCDFDAFCRILKDRVPLRPEVTKRTRAKTEEAFRKEMGEVWKSFFSEDFIEFAKKA